MNSSMKSKSRPFSASRQRRQQTKRRSSFDINQTAVIPHTISTGNTALLPCVDLRTISQKITDLREEMRLSEVMVISFLARLPFSLSLSLF